MIDTLRQVVQPLSAALPADTEVVLHDLRLLPHSVVAISGSVTGRVVGDPATDLLLGSVAGDGPDQHLGYAVDLEDGRQLHCSTIILRDSGQQRVAALCVNTDTGRWRTAQLLLASLVGAPGGANPSPRSDPSETFVRSVDELAALLLKTALDRVGIPVDLMRKKHKLRVVAELHERGMFTLRDAIDQVADALQVSRFTIYNYLNEISEHDEPSQR